MRSGTVARVACLFGLILWFATPANAEGLRLHEGRWRIELQGAHVLHSSKTDRDGDYFVSGNIEYEMPLRLHLTLGVRAYPFFYYPEPEPVYGVAAGLVIRYYARETREGFYGEAGSAPLWLSRCFSRNSSRVNFLNELGVGYKFPEKPWGLTLKYQHISNAGMGSENTGVNAFSLGVAYTF